MLQMSENFCSFLTY